MAKTAAQRQAQYRANRPYAGADGNGERRLSLWLSTEAALSIKRLARRYGVTKRELIEQLVGREEDRVLAAMAIDTPDWDRYFELPKRYAVTDLETPANPEQ